MSAGVGANRRTAWLAGFVAVSMAANYLALRMPLPPGALQQFELLLLVQVFVLWPLLFFLLRNPQNRKARSAILPVAAGMLFGSLVLPAESKHVWHYIDQLRWVVVLGFGAGELWVMLILFRSLGKLRSSTTPDTDIAEAMRGALGDKAGTRLLTVELLMWFYALLSWRAKDYRYAGREHFSIHRHEGNASNQVGFLVVLGVEIPFVHFFVWLWSPTAALVLTGLSLYGFAWMLGEYRATLLRPVSVDEQDLHLRYGLLGDERVPLSAIDAVERCAIRLRRRRGLLRRTPAGGTANVRIALRPMTQIAGLFGTKDYDTIVLAVDDPARFIDALRARLEHVARPGVCMHELKID
ncbi:hypothetical protein [Rugamonas rubra]|uniref:Uncharacterized protein n=1 Tax=Rugamonas rubra TaxID=758825 RepID=A0A1I4MM95_9BURK|nr:hypothetical protein [Rugamonas rubra]SFM04532.1 hypothetical protein SAMN02982985_02507 [Rugamonas rubra]